MATRRNALGRGIDALIPEAPSIPDVPGDRRSEIPVGEIRPNPNQPRRNFDEAELETLARSLRQHGVLQPIVVRELSPAAQGIRYELVVGERRWRAARKAGLQSIPATVADITPQSLLEVALVENVQRSDLNPIEMATAFRTLVDSGATQQQVGERVGLDRSSVSNHLRLLELSRDLQEDVESGKLSTGHAKALLQIQNPETRRQVRNRVINKGLSVRAAESLARSWSSGASGQKQGSGTEGNDIYASQLVEHLRKRLQTRVRLVGTMSKGKLEIEFYGADELNRIFDLISSGP